MAPRIAAVSDDLSTDFTDAARVAVEAGLDGLAVRHVGGAGVLDLDLDTVSAIRRTADAYGLAIPAVTTPIGRDLPLDADPARPAELLHRALVRAEVLGTPLVRVFAFWMPDRDAVATWASVRRTSGSRGPPTSSRRTSRRPGGPASR